MDPFSALIEDLAVVKACMNARVRVTSNVLQGVWRWFPEVEIVLPIPVMEGSEEWRLQVADDILSDMTVLCQKLSACYTDPEQELTDYVVNCIEELNGLWRELAGCLAETINETVPDVPAEVAEATFEEIVAHICELSGDDEETVRENCRTNPILRMALRRSGISPDTME